MIQYTTIWTANGDDHRGTVKRDCLTKGERRLIQLIGSSGMWDFTVLLSKRREGARV